MWRIVVLMILGAAAPPPKADVRCGSKCLYIALSSLDMPPASFEHLENLLGSPQPHGYRMDQLADAARQCGAKVLGVRTTFDNLVRRKERFACIAHVRGNHFVLFSDITSGSVAVIDAPNEYNVPLATMTTQWDGDALLISSQELATEETLRDHFSLWLVLTATAILAAAILCVERKRRWRLASP